MQNHAPILIEISKKGVISKKNTRMIRDESFSSVWSICLLNELLFVDSYLILEKKLYQKIILIFFNHELF